MSEEETQDVAALQALQLQLDEANRTIDHLERRAKIDALLADSDTIDVQAARLLTEQAVSLMDEPDVAAAVADLKRHKPYLFRRRERMNGALTMAARTGEDPAGDSASQAAQRATMSGDRRDLLRYLRMKRTR